MVCPEGKPPWLLTTRSEHLSAQLQIPTHSWARTNHKRRSACIRCANSPSLHDLGTVITLFESYVTRTAIGADALVCNLRWCQGDLLHGEGSGGGLSEQAAGLH